MKNVFFIIVIFVTVSNFLNADWILNAMYNKSDLKLIGAYRLKNGKRYSTYVDKKIKDAVQKSVTMIDYKNVTYPKTQGFLCIILENASGEKYELFFDSQSTHSIVWQRSKAKKITIDTQDTTDDTLHARAFLKFHGQDKAKVTFGYDDAQDVALDVIIQGTNGVYQLELDEPAR